MTDNGYLYSIPDLLYSIYEDRKLIPSCNRRKGAHSIRQFIYNIDSHYKDGVITSFGPQIKNREEGRVNYGIYDLSKDIETFIVEAANNIIKTGGNGSIQIVAPIFTENPASSTNYRALILDIVDTAIFMLKSMGSISQQHSTEVIIPHNEPIVIETNNENIIRSHKPLPCDYEMSSGGMRFSISTDKTAFDIIFVVGTEFARSSIMRGRKYSKNIQFISQFSDSLSEHKNLHVMRGELSVLGPYYSFLIKKETSTQLQHSSKKLQPQNLDPV